MSHFLTPIIRHNNRLGIHHRNNMKGGGYQNQGYPPQNPGYPPQNPGYPPQGQENIQQPAGFSSQSTSNTTVVVQVRVCCSYRKPPTISPPSISPPPPVYKPTTCTNAHLIPNISPPNISPPINISPCSNRCLIHVYSLFMTDLFMSDLFITNTKDRPCISPPVYKPPPPPPPPPPCISPSKIAYEII
jgi:hypothetical protein